MKKLIIIFFALTTISLAQAGLNRIIRYEMLDSILSARGLIDTSLMRTELDSILENWVNKHERQTITAQKNFTATNPIKLNADSSIILGGSPNAVDNGLWKQMRTGETQFSSLWLDAPDTSESGGWSVSHVYLDWVPSQMGRELAYHIKYNNTGKYKFPTFGFAMEPEYEVAYGTIYEWWFDFTYPGNFAPGYYTNRPFQVNQILPFSKNTDSITANMVISVDQLWMGHKNQGGYCLDWQFNEPGGSSLSIQDTFTIGYNINNLDWIYQMGSSGPGSQFSLIKGNNYNEVELSPMPGYKINLGNPISDSLNATLRWRNNANNADITISPDSLDWVNFAEDAGVSMQNIKIRGLKTDTTGTAVGDIVADPNTGILKTMLGENLLTNGDFTDWTGTGKGRIPDSWDFSALDTSVSYVEESPTGRLHFVTDGSVQDQLTSDVTQEVGVVYGYSFLVTQIVDSFNVFMPGWNVTVTQPGFYSGETTSLTGNPLASIAPLYGGGEITIDNYKIWKKSGAKEEFFTAGTDTFTTTATSDTVAHSSITANDIFVISINDATPVADDLLSWTAETGRLIVHRVGGTTSGLRYSYTRVK